MESTPITWLSDDVSQPLLRLNEQDSVAVALRALKAGETIGELTLKARVMKGHKVALQDIAQGTPVIKYAQVIGLASADITAGELVHSHNLAFAANEASSVAGSRYQAVDVQCTDQFMGYRRAHGRAGTRNFIAIISSVNCSATVAHRIANAFDGDALASFDNIDGVAAFTHGTGCGMAGEGDGFENLQRVITGYARHPNVGGVLIVGLGCEVSQVAATVEAGRMHLGSLLQTMNIQTTGGHVKTVQRGIDIVQSMLADVNRAKREPCPASDLALALQCGGSDAWSGITANPALGHASDRLVAQGACTVLAETPEIYGAEHLLTARATSVEVADELMARIAWWQDYVDRNRGSLDNNPSPGNKLGGLTTILEKSLGAVAKGGTSPLNGVFRYGQTIDRQGFVFMDSPGYDPASVTGQIASGCNLVVFTTGRGSTFGSKPAPCLKIATNTDMYRQLDDDMDIDAGTIVSAGESVSEVGDRIYDRLLALASGEASLSEQHGLGDNEFVPWQIGAVM